MDLNPDSLRHKILQTTNPPASAAPARTRGGSLRLEGIDLLERVVETAGGEFPLNEDEVAGIVLIASQAMDRFLSNAIKEQLASFEVEKFQAKVVEQMQRSQAVPASAPSAPEPEVKTSRRSRRVGAMEGEDHGTKEGPEWQQGELNI